jgi:hypothetical protein
MFVDESLFLACSSCQEYCVFVCPIKMRKKVVDGIILQEYECLKSSFTADNQILEVFYDKSVFSEQ